MEQPQADVEFDAIIAEHVLGISPDCFSSFYCGTIPPYSSDMGPAIIVFNHLVHLGLQVILARDSISEPYEVEVCTTADLYEQGYHGVYIRDDSPAMAICRAALYVAKQKKEHDDAKSV